MDTEGRDDEQRAGDDTEHVSDDGRPVAPAEVDSDITIGAVWLTKPSCRLCRVRLTVVGISRRTGAERSHSAELDQSYITA